VTDRAARTAPHREGFTTPYPKIELHVHLEATLRPERLLEIARRNDYPLPVDTVEGLRKLYQFRDFDHFIEVWIIVTNALRRADDFRQIVVDYAAEAARHDAVYIEGIFSPIERTWRGVSWDEIFSGYCDGAQEAKERHGLEVRLSPDITRSAPLEDALTMVQYAVKYRDRGVVGVGLGGEEALYPPEPFEPAFRAVREGGLGSVPHAGEVMGPTSIWGAITLDPVRIRHGITAVQDPVLMREILDRGIVLDVCPVSNLRTRAVPSLDQHPLPQLVEYGIACSISTDDPEMFDTDLSREYELATSFGIAPRALFEAGITGALCDEHTKKELAATAQVYPWPAAPARTSRFPVGPD
jgi:aminodeoxyfutalosine deaminase